MNAVDAIVMALTPGSLFNQNGKIFRSAKSLAQFAGIPQQEVLPLIAEHLSNIVTIRPSAKRPENGPLIALTAHLPLQAEPAGAPQIKIVAGNDIDNIVHQAKMDPLDLDALQQFVKQSGEQLDEEIVEEEEEEAEF